MLFIILFFITFITLIFLQYLKPNKKLPPGPTKIPVLGNVLQLGTDPTSTINKWSKEYGPILHLSMCGQDVVLLNDANCIRDMFNETAFIGKPVHPILSLFSNGPWGVISTEGEAWEVHRRFTLRGLRDVGFSKSSMEALIMDEVREITEWFSENDGKTISIGSRFNTSLSNSLWRIISGQRNSHTDSTIGQIMHDLLKSLNATFKRGTWIFPSMRFIVPEWCGYNDLVKNNGGLNAFVQEAVEEHLNTMVEDSPRDFIDLYLQEIKKAEPGSHFYGDIGKRHMIATITDLFLAGDETTSATLNWIVLYLCRYPSVQSRLHEEIGKVVGMDRKPLLSDRPNMPFTEAAIMEVMRISVLLPIGIPHSADRDQKFRGYLIKKNTMLIANLQYVLTCPEVWGDPENFRPERFLNEDGSKVAKSEHFIPFQAGRRQCLGESLAKDALFLFVACIYQQFEILPDPDNPKPDLKPVLGFVNSPKPFKLHLKIVQK